MIRVYASQLRRDRLTLAIWIVGLVLLVLGATASVTQEFGDEKGRAQIIAVAIATPSLLALRGVPNGPSLGSLMFFQIFSNAAVAVGLMNTFLAVRHGRGDEERGRRELIAAAPIPRSAPLIATVLLGLTADLVLAVLSAAAFIAGGLDPKGAVVAGMAIGATGLAYLGVGLLAGELVTTSRAANSVAATAVVIGYALRAAGDALGKPDLATLSVRSAWPTWLSPIGWGEQTFAFTSNRMWPLALSLGLAAVATAAGLLLHSRRELGDGVLPERAGRATARPTLRSAFGLAWRLQWPSLIGWSIGLASFGLAAGFLAIAIGNATLDNPNIVAVLRSLGHGSREDLILLFMSAIMALVSLVASAAALQAVVKLREEESSGRAELVLAAPVSRTRWLLATVLVGAISTAVVLLACAFTTWLSFRAAGDADLGRRAVEQAVLELPVGLVFVGVGVVVVAALPRFSAGLTWGLFGLAVAIGLLGGLLQLPHWVLDASPLVHVPSVPVEHWSGLLGLLAAAAVGVTAALFLIRRRDLST
jgi:ABC-2 type transport system permease protein